MDLLQPGVLASFIVFAYFFRFLYQFLRARTRLASIGFLPGARFLCGPSSLLGQLIPPISNICRTRDWHFRLKHQLHKTYASDVVSCAQLFNPKSLVLYVADASIAKEVLTNRIDFAKPLKMYKTVSILGPNIVGSEFGEWKRYRRIATPSFGERFNKLAHEETTRITASLFQFWSANGEGDVVKVENVVDVFVELGLMVVSGAGFGFRFGWGDRDEPPQGHTMTFHKSLSLVLEDRFYRYHLGDKVRHLWKNGRQSTVAFEELRLHMKDMIEEHRQSMASGGEETADLLSNLINGISPERDEEQENQLLQDELLGNMFIILLAAHETTGHSLGFTLALLAIHQDIQEEAFNELRKIVPQGETPTYAHIMSWAYGLATIYESLRMYPPLSRVPKCGVNDKVFTTSSTDGKNTPISIPVPAGVDIMVNIAGLHYNPKYWDEPEVFRPKRFLGTYNRDAFVPFSGGPRVCLGRRYAEIEMLTLLANVVLKYRVTSTPTGQKETPEQMSQRLLQWHQGLVTVMPVKVPLTFTARNPDATRC